MLCRSVILAALAFAIGADSAVAEIRTRQDAKGTVYEVDGIVANPTDCHPYPIQGRVVGRKFTGNEVKLDSITLEQKDGTRDIVNVDSPPANLSMADLGFVTSGMQRLSKVGRVMHGRAFACGAAGRVSYLDEIR